MNTASRRLSDFALALVAAAGVHAETYEGVTKITSAQSRAAVRVEGVAAARGGDPFSDAAWQGVTSVACSVDRAPNPTLDAPPRSILVKSVATPALSHATALEKRSPSKIAVLTTVPTPELDPTSG